MAGTVTTSKTGIGSIKKYTWSWTSDASGDADQTLEVNGKIRRVVTNPGAAAPTANYDIVFNDEDGVDVMAGGLADRHTSTTEQVISDPPVAVAGLIDAVVSNAGNAKNGTIVVYVEE